MIGIGVAEVEDVATGAQRGEELGAPQGSRGRLLGERGCGLAQSERRVARTSHRGIAPVYCLTALSPPRQYRSP